MKNAQTTQSFGVVGFLIVAVALIVAAATPGGSVVSSVDDEPPGTEYLSTETGQVVAKHATGGLKIAGVRLQGKTYRLDMHYLAGPDCADANPTDTHALCRGPDGLTGEVIGRTAEGEAIVNARLEVSRACYTLIDPADPWPSYPEYLAIAGEMPDGAVGNLPFVGGVSDWTA